MTINRDVELAKKVKEEYRQGKMDTVLQLTAGRLLSIIYYMSYIAEGDDMIDPCQFIEFLMSKIRDARREKGRKT